MSDINAARSALINHLSSCGSWDEKADKLTDDFARIMLENGYSHTSTIQELVSAGLAKQPAKQVVASITKELGLPPEPHLIEKKLSEIKRRFNQSRLMRKVHTFPRHYKYIIITLILTAFGGTIYYGLTRYKLTTAEQLYLQKIKYQPIDREPSDEPRLHKAIHKNYFAVAKYLIEGGVDVNITDPRGFTALHWVRSVKIAKLLLRNGANPKIQSNNEMTPLHTTHNASIVKMLIRYGADENAKDYRGETPLDHCLSIADIPKANILMKNNGHVGSGQGASIINTFAENDRYYNELVNLLNAGANPNASGIPSGLKPIHAAVIGNSIRNVKLLLSRGADINAILPPEIFVGKSLDVLSAQANQYQNNRLSEGELAKKYDITFVEGMTPLQVAEKMKLYQMAKFLRNKGAR